MRNEEIVRLEISGRVFHLIPNIFPAREQHFVLTRSGWAEAAQLVQAINDETNLLDLMAIQRGLPTRLSMLFNGGLPAGASINHFHAHVLEFGRVMRNAQFRVPPITSCKQGVQMGQYSLWPAATAGLRAPQPPYLAQLGFKYVELLHQQNRAYNMVFYRYKNGMARMVAFPRKACIPTIPINGRTSIFSRLAGGFFGRFAVLVY